MYILYYSPGSASMAVHQTLLEVGVAHELRKLDFEARAHKSADYLALNPNGMVPTLIVDGQPYYECAALLMLLAERHASATLAPAPGASGRALWLQWMVHFANTLQPAYRQWFYPQDFAPLTVEQESRDYARKRIEAVWDRLDAHLGSGPGPYILGEEFSVADVYAMMLMRWSRNMPRPATAWPNLDALAARVKVRPSWQRVCAIEGLSDWI